MKITDAGVTAPKGFMAAGVKAEIKYKNRLDMAMLYSKVPCVVAGTFTSNIVKAAPVKWDMNIVYNSEFAQAVVINTGIANAGTGKQGMEYCENEAKLTAKLLNIPESAVLVGSTGVIGNQLNMERLEAGINALVKELGETREHARTASKAIMTTDTKNKEASAEIEIGGKKVTIGGMSKGSGMIHPNMCTMLGYVTTDINIDKELLQKALSEDVKDTFNMITVDGDTSTNDTLLLFANGMAGNEKIVSEDEDYKKFKEALHYVNETLAKKMAADGEGAGKLVEVSVINADDKEKARILARSVAGSNLTKAAMFGNDSNFGRILCAMGYSGAKFDPDKVDIYYEAEGKKMLIFSDGLKADYDEDEATKLLDHSEVRIIADMKEGDIEATAWGCDLTYDYVKINADYRS
ncbi:MAG: bifunctional glutamate N-acetyltransferase/amino-acid acetyltransferase ArgJ [Lachnospiraceae bacterium]|nr:bifunctional glutamate N-acetyltransferase/amino-acid acetyltransferase ArgJ [Lachnospiraceae bacterium]